MSCGVLALGAGCSVAGIPFGVPVDQDTPVQLGVAIAQPSAATTAAIGASTVIQWADIARIPGTVVRITAQRQNDARESLGDPIHLAGDGTSGSGRDALADGDNDVYTWDITGMRVGDYVIFATIEAPDGTTSTAASRNDDIGTAGVITVTTSLPVPELTFTAPADSDVTVGPSDVFDFTWTDNGTENADAVLTLGLDTDADHDSGNEITLLRDQPLSGNDDNGQFRFTFADENGDAVAAGTYTVFATLDDNANQIVTAEAAGRLILTP